MAPDDTTPQTLVGIAFPDRYRAQEFHTAVIRLASKGHLQLKDAVFVTSRDDGRVMVKETADPQPGPAALSGALWLGLLGLILGGPLGWVIGLVGGAAVGAVAAKVIDLGISDEWVHWFRLAVEPGDTILALLTEDLDRNALSEELRRFHHNAHLVYANVEPSWIEQIREALGESSSWQEPWQQRPSW